MDPITLIMFGLIAVLIIFMFRNGKKRQAAAQELQNSLRPGAEVMLQSGIFGTLESIDLEANRATVTSGTSTIVVHRSAITQVVQPAETLEEESPQLAPDDDPAFGESITKDQSGAEGMGESSPDDIGSDNDDQSGPEKPKA